MLRARVVIIAVIAGPVVLGACGLQRPDAPPTTLEEPPAPLAPGCSPPRTDLLRYTSGFATVEITSGPGTGLLRLPTAGRETSSNFSGRYLRGEWNDAAKNLLIISVEDVDECRANPRAYVQIEPQGRTGPRSADTLPRFAEVYPPKSCKVELTTFSSQGVDGAFTCTRLGGGRADSGSGWARPGVFIDASGTFSLRA